MSAGVLATVATHCAVSCVRWSSYRRWSIRFWSIYGSHFKVRKFLASDSSSIEFRIIIPFCPADEEDLFMVSDLLTGGDLRYHLLQEVRTKPVYVQVNRYIKYFCRCRWRNYGEPGAIMLFLYYSRRCLVRRAFVC